MHLELLDFTEIFSYNRKVLFDLFPSKFFYVELYTDKIRDFINLRTTL